MARTSAPGVHVRPTLLVAAGVALLFARIWGPAGEDATRLSFVVLLAATVGNLLAAVVVVHKTSTRIVDNPSDAVVGEPRDQLFAENVVTHAADEPDLTPDEGRGRGDVGRAPAAPTLDARRGVRPAGGRTRRLDHHILE